jgi:dATP pyrophosphohydrolase
VLVFLHAGEGTDRLYLLLHRRPERFAIWQGVTGGVEEGETVRETALREVREETGFELSPHELTPFGEPHSFHPGEFFRSLHPGQSDITEHLFHAEVPRSDPVLSTEEHDAFRWCRLDECFALLHWEANKRAIQELDALLRSDGDPLRK